MNGPTAGGSPEGGDTLVHSPGAAFDLSASGDSYDPLVFCISDGAGGFGGIYWLDDRATASG